MEQGIEWKLRWNKCNDGAAFRDDGSRGDFRRSAAEADQESLHPGCRHGVSVSAGDMLSLQVQPGTDRAGRKRALEGYYRELLHGRVPQLLAVWQPAMRVSAREWRTKRMKTRWGTCNIAARRIWLNLELAKKPERCLEYVVVHELTHLLERNHTKRFYVLMDRFLPDWRERRDELNTVPPGCE